MSRILTSLLAVALAGLAQAQQKSAREPKSIEIESKVLQMPVETAKRLGLQSVDGEKAAKYPSILSAAAVTSLIQHEGIAVISAPQVTVNSSENASIDIARELRSPIKFDNDKGFPNPSEFQTTGLGFSMQIKARIEDKGKIALRLDAKITTLDGWVAYKDGKTSICTDGTPAPGGIALPVIGRTQAASDFTVQSEETVLLGGFPTLSSKGLEEYLEVAPSAQAASKEPLLQFLLLTVRTFDENGIPISAPSHERELRTEQPRTQEATLGPAIASAGNIPPYGIPTGTPGFVLSPHASVQKYVDLRGIPRDMEVKCPYTGKLFLVP